MLVPDVFRRNGFDEFFEDSFRMPPHPPVAAMKTDIKETADGYELAIDLPGIDREHVQAELHEGYLTVSAETTQDKDEKDENGRYIRRERFRGKYSRSFFVGDAVTSEDIRAHFENGVLYLDVPKKEKTPPKKKSITID